MFNSYPIIITSDRPKKFTLDEMIKNIEGIQAELNTFSMLYHSELKKFEVFTELSQLFIRLKDQVNHFLKLKNLTRNDTDTLSQQVREIQEKFNVLVTLTQNSHLARIQNIQVIRLTTKWLEELKHINQIIPKIKKKKGIEENQELRIKPEEVVIWEEDVKEPPDSPAKTPNNEPFSCELWLAKLENALYNKSDNDYIHDELKKQLQNTEVGAHEKAIAFVRQTLQQELNFYIKVRNDEIVSRDGIYNRWWQRQKNLISFFL